MANDLIDIESFCGFCNTRVGASLEDRRKHMFGCKKHPAYHCRVLLERLADTQLSNADFVVALRDTKDFLSQL